MDIFDFIFLFPVAEAAELFLRDRFYGGPGVWYYLPCSGSERGGPERDFGPSR